MSSPEEAGGIAMSVDAVVSSVREHGLVPIRLQLDPANDDKSFWPFEGSLEDFLQTVKALGSKAVYLVAYTFDQDSLVFSPEEDPSDDDFDDGEDDGEDEDDDELAEDDDETRLESIDLVAEEPRLGPYKTRVGEHYCVSILAMTDEAKLHFDLFAPWHGEFEALADAVVERLQSSTEARERAHEAAQEIRRENKRTILIRELERLPTVPAFRDLKTKGAMTAYVGEHFPSAKTLLGAGDFRNKLTELHQKALLERSRR